MSMNESVANMMIDKLIARGLIYGRLTYDERQMRVRDICSTYMGYDRRLVYEAFADWLNNHHGVPAPSDIIPLVERKARAIQSYRELVPLTPEQIAELRELCHQYGANRRAWLDYAAEGDPAAEGRPDATPKIVGTYADFRKKIEKALKTGRLG